ncbi:MAG: dihydroorotate dehydrogenase [Candidatus Altiarchaeales archaeon]|nr:dihydroorotate dehydrogenase [Candidatus Altiarchaeales archaeon]MBD3416274.1 dihydroorotate dehydrogenase [Candidatus Altiarchaeales archaeon]
MGEYLESININPMVIGYSMADLSVELAGIRLKNPTILASGIMGSDKASLKKVADSGAGAVTIKSISKDPKSGHPNPTVVEVEGGFLNAIGYCNMGLENAKLEFAAVSSVGVPVIASIVAEDAEGFTYLAEEMSALEFSAIELALSCPHTPGLGLLAGQGTPEATFEITKRVCSKAKLPVIVKMSPNSLDLGEIAKSAVKAGAKALNMGNSLGPGMVIETKSGKPVLDFKVGGMSGPIVKPIAVRCVYDVYEATRGKVPVIGTGGVAKGLDAVEMIMAGASAVGIGTGVYYQGLNVFREVSREIEEFMKRRGVQKLRELVGVAHG